MKQTLLSIVFLLFCVPLFGQNFVVNTTLDAVDVNPGDGVCADGTGSCSLRAAVMESNALGGTHSITIGAGVYGLTIPGGGEDAAATGDLDFLADITLIGASSQTSIINADSLDRVIHVLPGSTSSITLTTLQEGYAFPGNGGGVYNQGDLTITYSLIEGNSAELTQGLTTSEGFGGGIANEGNLTLSNTTLSNNESKGGRGTNGLNGGGGGGSTPGFGGGFYNSTTGNATLANVTISGNRVYGGRHSSGSVNAGNWNFVGQDGAGLNFGAGGAAGGGVGSAGGVFSGGGGGGSEPFGGGTGGAGGFGAGGGGGGASAGGGNGGTGGASGHGGGTGGLPCCSYGGGGGAGSGMGGGVFNEGTIVMNSSTVAFNEAFGGQGASGWGGWAWGGSGGSGFGGGLFNHNGTFEINNTIVSNNNLHNNTLDNDPVGVITSDDVDGAFASSFGHNLIQEPGMATLSGTTTGNVLNADPALLPLSMNGGETPTHEIIPCPPSPAVNAADNASAELLDQRDYVRNGTADIGAFEADPADFDISATVVEPCAGDLTGEINVTASNGTAPYSYQWGANAGNQTTAQVTGLAGGTYTVNIVDDSGCLKDTTITLVELPSPVIDLGNDTTLCDGSMLNLDAGNPGAVYQWSDNSTNQVLQVNSVGNYSVVVTDANSGCTATDDINVVMEQLPNAGSDNYILMCNSNPEMDVNTMLDPGVGGGTWSETSGVQSGEFDAATGMLGMTSTMEGIYTFQYLVEGTFCPSDSIEMTIEVLNQPTAGADNFDALCSTDGFYNVSDLLEAGVNSGTWSETSVTPSGQFDIASGNLNANGLPGGTYSFEYTTDPSAPCVQDVAEFTLQITETPIVSFTTDPTEGCEPLLVNFQNNSIVDASATCLWDFGDGNTTSNYTDVSNEYLSAGCYDVTLTMTFNGCVGTSTVDDAVCVHMNPIADFNWEEAQIYSDDPTATFINQSSNAVQYNWEFGDGTTSNSENPTHTYELSVAQNYLVTLTAISDQGCRDSITKALTVKEIILFYIPNTFTPDGDEYNNVFKPVMTQGIDTQDFELYIYNRWGQMVFESHDVNEGWDGTFKGKMVQDGTYTWKLSFGDINTDERHTHTGHINMIR